MNDQLIQIAKILKPHGIKGDAKIISFSDNPVDVFNYPQLFDSKLNEYTLKRRAQEKEFFIVRINDLNNRTAIEQLAGTKLYITREMMPKMEQDQHYYADLINMQLLDLDRKPQAIVVAVYNFGAGDVIEAKLLNKKETIFLPFEKTFVHMIDKQQKYLIFDFQQCGFCFNSEL